MNEGGARAASNGKAVEDVINGVLHQITTDVQRQYSIGLGIYGTEIFVDFYCLSLGQIIESKWQGSNGTADEKLPYLAENIIQNYPLPTTVVLSGDGFRSGAIDWMRSRLAKTSDHQALTMNEFLTWAFKQKHK